jgi:hypothetical protein
MIDLIIYALCFALGWILREQLAIRRIDKLMEENAHMFDEEDDSVIALTIDKLEDTFFIYEKKTNAFVMQVKTREEMFDTLKNSPKYQGRTFVMSKDDLKLFDTV